MTRTESDGGWSHDHLMPSYFVSDPYFIAVVLRSLKYFCRQERRLPVFLLSLWLSPGWDICSTSMSSLLLSLASGPGLGAYLCSLPVGVTSLFELLKSENYAHPLAAGASKRNPEIVAHPWARCTWRVRTTNLYHDATAAEFQSNRDHPTLSFSLRFYHLYHCHERSG